MGTIRSFISLPDLPEKDMPIISGKNSEAGFP